MVCRIESSFIPSPIPFRPSFHPLFYPAVDCLFHSLFSILHSFIISSYMWKRVFWIPQFMSGYISQARKVEKVGIQFASPIRNSRFSVKSSPFFLKRKHLLEEISFVYTFFCVCWILCPHVRARARIIVKKETHKHIYVYMNEYKSKYIYIYIYT